MAATATLGDLRRPYSTLFFTSFFTSANAMKSTEEPAINEPPAPLTNDGQKQRPKRGCYRRRSPKKRDCRIYERHILNREPQERVAAEYAISQQRVAQISARVEAWIAAHPEHPLATRMRLRCSRRWETLWSEAMTSFARSREDRTTRKERTQGGTLPDGGRAPLATVCEEIVREQNGDPRFLQVAWRAANREQQLWLPSEKKAAREQPASIDRDANESGKRECLPYDERFPYLPAALADLERLACGLRNATEGVPYRDAEDAAYRDAEGVPYRDAEGAACRGAEDAADRHADGVAPAADRAVPVSTLFERRCAEAFRCLGFDVRELGQGCGRVADCLAIAAAERFAVIIDAKVRRRGYTLGTDDRQFCEYATRHTRELALSGIDKVYFAVVGRGFRQQDLDKLAGFMSGTPIRSVVFIEADALMSLVNDSIRDRRQFRLDDLDRLLFGNKIIGEKGASDGKRQKAEGKRQKAEGKNFSCLLR
jgi:hypothetical protein